MLLAALAAGCGDGAAGTATSTGTGALETTGGTTGTTGGTTGPTSGAVGATSTGPGVTGSDTTCDIFCDPTTGEPAPDRCDPIAQDCPEGEKCAPYAPEGSYGGSSTKCVPVTGDGKPGEPCMTVDGALSGLDDCEKGAWCSANLGNAGVCIEMCSGSVNDPSCKDPDKFYCSVNDEGNFNLCIAYCDPLLQDCAGDGLCLPDRDNFLCWWDASGPAGQAFDPCEYNVQCDRGLLCAPSASASECDPGVDGCCLPFCDLTDANASCPGVGQDCVSLYDEGMAPEKYAKVGYCTIPN